MSTGVYGEWLRTIGLTVETDEKRIENIDYSCLFFDGNISIGDYFTRIIYLLPVALRTPWQMIFSSYIQNFVAIKLGS